MTPPTTLTPIPGPSVPLVPYEWSVGFNILFVIVISVIVILWTKTQIRRCFRFVFRRRNNDDNGGDAGTRTTRTWRNRDEQNDPNRHFSVAGDDDENETRPLLNQQQRSWRNPFRWFRRNQPAFNDSSPQRNYRESPTRYAYTNELANTESTNATSTPSHLIPGTAATNPSPNLRSTNQNISTSPISSNSSTFSNVPLNSSIPRCSSTATINVNVRKNPVPNFFNSSAPNGTTFERIPMKQMRSFKNSMSPSPPIIKPKGHKILTQNLSETYF